MEFTTIHDYLAVLRRRKGRFLAVTVPILAISIAVAFGLSSVYESTATILIEQQDIPQDLVETTVTSYAAERIQTISQRVMTRNNLDRIIDKYNLLSGSGGAPQMARRWRPCVRSCKKL